MVFPKQIVKHMTHHAIPTNWQKNACRKVNIRTKKLHSQDSSIAHAQGSALSIVIDPTTIIAAFVRDQIHFLIGLVEFWL